ncbi:MAG TPA: SH3 domain-containing protein [Rhizobiaceae bacterium]|nr:SH3 domain-containing protein [Rhizobiaceae bacterium]
MIRTITNTTIALAIASTVAFMAGQARAAAFVAWEVSNVPWGDVLNVRKFPSSTSQKQAAYPNGAVLSMTGKCTGGVDLFNIAGLPAHQQAQIVRYKWCQVWHDPAQNGNFVAGWVYGRYITPH